MNVTATGLCGVAFFLVTGLALVDLVPGLSRRTPAGWIGFGYVLGMAWTAGGMYFLSHVFGMTLRRGTILPIALAPVILALARRIGKRAIRRTSSGEGTSPSSPSRKSLVVLSLFSFLVPAFVTVGVFSEATTDPVTDWDGRMTWVAHARYIREERTVSPRALVERTWSAANADYPLLIPLAQVAAQETFDMEDDERLIRPLYAAFFPVFLLLLFDGASALAGPCAASITVVVASVVPMFAFEPHGGAMGCYSDLPLGCFFGAGLLILIPLGRGVGLVDGLAAGLLLSAAVLTKTEGLLLALAGLAIGSLRSLTVFLKQRQRGTVYLRTLAAPALTAACVLGAAVLYLSWRAGVSSHSFDEASHLLYGKTWLNVVPQLVRSLPPAVASMADRREWSFFWFLVPLVAIAGRHALRMGRARRLLLGATAPLAVAFAAYGTFGWELSWFVGVTFARFLEQGALPFLCFFAMCLRETLRSVGLGRFPRERAA